MSTRTKILGGLAATSLLLVSGAALAGTIVGSAHDFSGLDWSTDDICKACHAPHNNLSTTGLLWNHTQSIATYTVYTSPTFSQTAGQPAGTSKLCMSCHDGTVALDNYGGVTTGTATIAASANFGTSLVNDHPISFPYTVTGEELRATTTAVTFGDASTGTIADMLDAGSVQCQSCHDVHNTKAAPSTPLLLKANTDSALCLTCHIK